MQAYKLIIKTADNSRAHLMGERIYPTLKEATEVLLIFKKAGMAGTIVDVHDAVAYGLIDTVIDKH
tara:strand:- start:284 stop:481 length:198 start_codon:yes stop_codon:yes gene_type:complete